MLLVAFPSIDRSIPDEMSGVVNSASFFGSQNLILTTGLSIDEFAFEDSKSYGIYKYLEIIAEIE